MFNWFEPVIKKIITIYVFKKIILDFDPRELLLSMIKHDMI